MVEQTKKCTKCGERKPLSAFYKMRGTPTGRRCACILCARKAKRAAADAAMKRCSGCGIWAQRRTLQKVGTGSKRLCAGCLGALEIEEQAAHLARAAELVASLRSNDPEPRTMREYYNRCAADEVKTAAAVDRLRANTLEVLGR